MSSRSRNDPAFPQKNCISKPALLVGLVDLWWVPLPVKPTYICHCGLDFSISKDLRKMYVGIPTSIYGLKNLWRDPYKSDDLSDVVSKESHIHTHHHVAHKKTSWSTNFVPFQLGWTAWRFWQKMVQGYGRLHHTPRKNQMAYNYTDQLNILRNKQIRLIQLFSYSEMLNGASRSDGSSASDKQSWDI